MLESLITLPPPKGIEPDYPYNEDTMFRIIKNPVEDRIIVKFSNSDVTVHYGSQDSAVEETIIKSDATVNITIPANVTEFFLKQVTPGISVGESQLTGRELVSITWNPKLKIKRLNFINSSKLTTVSEYLPEGIDSLSSTFSSCSVFNQDLSNWNIYGIKTLDGIFQNARKFNGDITNWNTSNVISMQNAFRNASAFSQDISNWDISRVTYLQSCFQDANSFNVDISKWNTSNVTNIGYLFYNNTIFNQNLSGWNVAKVTIRTSFDTGATAWVAANKPKFT